LTSQKSKFTDTQILEVLSKFASASISVYDSELRYHFVSESFAKIHGLTPQAMLGLKITDVEKSHNLPVVLPNIQRALQGEKVAYERKVTNHNEGLTGWRIISLAPWRDKAGNIIGVVNCGLSVNELKSTTEELRAANQRLTSHMENSPLAVIEFDNKLNITYASPRAEHMFGWLIGTGKGLALQTLLGPDNRGRHKLLAAFNRLQTGLEPNNRIETTNIRSDNVAMHCEWFSSALTGDNGAVVSIMSLIQDVSDRVKLTEQMRALAERDSLTGLLNRSAFRIQIERSLSRTLNEEPGALLFIDLDGFKQVNDTLGHAAGDSTLREVAHRITSVVRSNDIVARIGGDEFVVLLETGVSAQVVDEVCKRIINAVSAPYTYDLSPLAPPASLPRVSASIGVVQYSPKDSDGDDLLRRADSAMYEAKHAGKGRIKYAS
jgi:diguanylate cyclase (GGDEF)-like protein/PAS domain S-box-containing protein